MFTPALDPAQGTSTTQHSPERPSSIRFEDRQRQSGVAFVLNNSTTADKPMIDSPLGGVALLDFDNDGYLDIFFANGARIPGLVKDDPSFHNRLYRNNRDGTFSDATAAAGVQGAGYNMGAAAADFDNDGFEDLYVTGFNRNTLYRNDGRGKFVDVTEKAGVSIVGADGRKPWSVGAAWVDFDADGRLDLFVTNYLDWSFATSKVCGPPGKRLSCSPALYKGLPNTLLHNNGDGTFTDVSAASGVGDHVGKGMGIAIADYDRDGRPDIFVANDNDRNFLFHNLGAGRFAEVAVEAGVAFTDDGIPVSNMGADFRDWNNDGLPDIFVTALGGETFPLYRNEGRGFFNAETYKAGLGFSTFRMSGWGNGVFDFDNDGHKDLFSANSHASENADLDKRQRYKQANAVFLNRGNGTFLDVTAFAGPAFRIAAAHRGAAFGDLNNDGKMDAVVSAIGGAAELLYNTSTANNRWILLELVGTKSNRDGIGAAVKITGAAGLVQYNHATTAGSYASSLDRRVHFGLGADPLIREIEIKWPGGGVQKLRNVRADQILKVREE